jgi:hypothetical protein
LISSKGCHGHGCINNKDTFLCVLRLHVRVGHLLYLLSYDLDAAANDCDFGGGDRQGKDMASKFREDALRAGYQLPKPAGYPQAVKEAQYTDHPGTMY